MATITGWSWNFGDGATSTLQNPTHVYAAPGTYTVTLTVTTSDGGSDSEVKVGYIVAAVSALIVVPAGLGTAQSFGAPVIKAAITKPSGGVFSAQAFGTPTIAKGGVTRAAAGVSSAQQFGTLTFRLTKQAGGVASAQQFGAPLVQLRGPPQTVQVPGLGPPAVTQSIVGQFLVGQRRVGYTGGQFGHPDVFTAQVVPAVTGVPSGQQFGTFIPKRFFTVPGVPSSQAFGTVRPAYLIHVGGVSSTATVGTIHLMYPQWIPVGGVQSTAAIGRPRVLRTVTPVSCTGLPSASVDCTTLPSVQAGCDNLTTTAPAAPVVVLTPADTEDLTLTEV